MPAAHTATQDIGHWIAGKPNGGSRSRRQPVWNPTAGAALEFSRRAYTRQKSVMQRWPDSIAKQGRGAEFVMPTAK